MHERNVLTYREALCTLSSVLAWLPSQRKQTTRENLLLGSGVVSDVEGELWPCLEIHPMVVLKTRPCTESVWTSRTPTWPGTTPRAWRSLCALCTAVWLCKPLSIHRQQSNFCTLEDLLLCLFQISCQQTIRLDLLHKHICSHYCKHLHCCYCYC